MSFRSSFARRVANVQIAKAMKDTFKKGISDAFEQIKDNLKLISPSFLDNLRKINSAFDLAKVNIDKVIDNLDFSKLSLDQIKALNPSDIKSFQVKDYSLNRLEPTKFIEPSSALSSISSFLDELNKTVQSSITDELNKLSVSQLNVTKINDLTNKLNIAYDLTKQLANNVSQMTNQFNKQVSDLITEINTKSFDIESKPTFFKDQNTKINAKYDSENIKGSDYFKQSELNANLTNSLSSRAFQNFNLGSMSFSRLDDVNKANVDTIRSVNSASKASGSFDATGKANLNADSKALVDSANAKYGQDLNRFNAIDKTKARPDSTKLSSKYDQSSASINAKQANIKADVSDVEFNRKVESNTLRNDISKPMTSKANSISENSSRLKQLETQGKLNQLVNSKKISPESNLQVELGKTVSSKFDANAKLKADLDLKSLDRYNDINKANIDSVRKTNASIDKLDEVKKTELEARRKAAMNDAEIKRLELERSLDLERKINLDKEKIKKTDTETLKKKNQANAESKKADAKRKIDEKDYKNKSDLDRSKKADADELKRKKNLDAEKDRLKKADADKLSKWDRVKKFLSNLAALLGIGTGIWFLSGTDTPSGPSSPEEQPLYIPPPPPSDETEDSLINDKDTTKMTDKDTTKTTKRDQDQTTLSPKTEPTSSASDKLTKLLKTGIMYFFYACIILMILYWIWKRMFGSSSNNSLHE